MRVGTVSKKVGCAVPAPGHPVLASFAPAPGPQDLSSSWSPFREMGPSPLFAFSPLLTALLKKWAPALSSLLPVSK